MGKQKLTKSNQEDIEGARVAQSIEGLIQVSAQVMISWFMNLSLVWGPVLVAWSLHGILFLPLSLPLLCSLSLNK